MRRLSIERLKPGMKLSVPIRDENDNILLNRNIELTARYIERLKQLGFQTVYISDPDLIDVQAEEILADAKRAEAIRHLKNSYKTIDQAVKALRAQSTREITSVLQSPKFKKSFNYGPLRDNTTRIVSDIIEDVVSSAALNGLNSLKTFDNYTYNHSIDVTVTAIMLGKKLQFNARQLQDLAVGCLLHDIGKLFIPIDILNKQGKLTPEEFEIVKEHPTIGYEILRNFLPILSTHVAYQHHERQDGSGYPRGVTGSNKLKRSDQGNSIALFGEITAIADVYDALISDRPYRRAMLHDDVVELLQNNAYTQFNAEVLNSFLSIIPKYPVGSNCEVVKGEYEGFSGVVIAIDPDQLNIPTIRLLYDRDGERMKPVDLNLRKKMDAKIKLIEV